MGPAALLGTGAPEPGGPSEQPPGRRPPGWDRRDRRNREVRNGPGASRPPSPGALTKHGGRGVVPALHAKAAALSKDGGADRLFPGRLSGAGEPLETGAETPAPPRPAEGLG